MHKLQHRSTPPQYTPSQVLEIKQAVDLFLVGHTFQELKDFTANKTQHNAIIGLFDFVS